MKITDFIPAVLAIIGVKEFHTENGKKVLTKQEKEQLSGSGFPAQFITDLEAALNDGGEPAAKGDESRRSAVLTATLGQVTSQLTQANTQLEAARTATLADKETIAALQGKVTALEQQVVALAEMPEPDTTAAVAAAGQPAAWNLGDDRQLGGRPGVMYAMDRPYNQRARAAMLAAQGMQMPVAVSQSVDYSTLREDLGAFYRQTWRDKIQSMLVELPSCESIFPLESGYQDLATLPNVWLGEFSQAQNTDSDFDKVTKGSYELGAETLRMSKVMFSYKFKKLDELEKSWIGYLNREGSNVIKMSFIEFLLAETAKKLHNERELRRINGVRRDPKLNEPGQALEAADGFYESVRKWCEGYVDFTPNGGQTGRTVYQVKPFDLEKITDANISDVVYQGTSMVPAHIRDTGRLVLYMPSALVAKYHKCNETKYGMNQDYAGPKMCVKEYTNVRIIPVPNADNHNRLVWTIEGNIKLYEHVAGEMLNFAIEQQDWSLKVWSTWKEGIWAEAIGYKYTDRNLMDGSRQMVWCNNEDRPSTYYQPGRRDAQPDVTINRNVETVANSSVLTITDIAGAQVGVPVAIRCGAGGEQGVRIEKAGNFELIAADWTPAQGDVIRLIKRADGKFVELERTTAATGAYAFAADATAPSVAGANIFVTGVNTKATALTDLADAVSGEVYTIYGTGAANATTVANGGKFVLTDAITLKEGAMLQVVKAADGKFYEIARA